MDIFDLTELFSHPNHRFVSFNPEQLDKILMTVSTAAQAIVDASAKRTAAIEANTAAIAALTAAAGNAGAQETEDLGAISTAMDDEDTAVAAQTAALPPPVTAPPMTIAPNPPPAAVAGTAFDVTFVPADAVGTVSVSVSAGALPPGGVITGLEVNGFTPASGDVISYTLTFTDQTTPTPQTVMIAVSETVA
jgi:hypothetical protein